MRTNIAPTLASTQTWLQRAFWTKPRTIRRRHSSTRDDDDDEPQENRQKLTRFDLLMVGIGGTVGTGVFATAGFIAHTLAGPAAVLSWLIAGFGCMLSALAFMECTTLLPAGGGSTYAYTYATLGELPAMIAGFLLTLEYGVSSAGGARSWSTKFRAWLGQVMRVMVSNPDDSDSNSKDSNSAQPILAESIDVDGYAALLMLVCMIIVLCGISTGKRFINVMTSIKIAVVLFIIITGLFHLRLSNLTQPFLPPRSKHNIQASDENSETQHSFGWSGVMLGASMAFYGYIGYDEVCCLSRESLNPTRDIPQAVVGTIVGATILSALSTLSLVGMVKYTDIDHDASYGRAFDAIGLPWAKWIVETGEVLTMPVGVLIGFLAQPQLLEAMTKDGLLPESLSLRSSSGTIVSGLALALISLFVRFEILWDFISLGILVAFNLTNVSVLFLRYGLANDDDSVAVDDDSKSKARWTNVSHERRPVGQTKSEIIKIMILVYVVLTFGAAMLWQKGVVSHLIVDKPKLTVHERVSNRIRGLNQVAVGVLLASSGACVGQIWNLAGAGDRYIGQPQVFRAPGVPFVPCLAILFNWFLFAQMHVYAIWMIVAWAALAIVVYFGYSQHHSLSRNSRYEQLVEEKTEEEES